MVRTRGPRLLGEFIVIVLGVLVALAVDDVAQYRADRQLEAHLLERLREDLTADAADLALAQVQVARRQWLFGAIAQALETGAFSPPPDSVVHMERQYALLAALESPNAPFALDWPDVGERPLLMLGGYPEFDISDDSYQEMLSRGALRVVRDPEVRSAVLAYYRVAEDIAADVMVLEEYAFSFKRTLADHGVAYGDSVGLIELGRLLGGDASFAGHARRAQLLLADQGGFLAEIENRRLALERALAEREGAG
jgi:hypothetical protein